MFFKFAERSGYISVDIVNGSVSQKV